MEDYDAQVDLLVSVAGVSEQKASEALEKCNGDVDRAMEKLLDDDQQDTAQKNIMKRPAPDSGGDGQQPASRRHMNPRSTRHKEEYDEDSPIAKPGAPRKYVPASNAAASRAANVDTAMKKDIDALRSAPPASSSMMAVAASTSNPTPNEPIRSSPSPTYPGAIAVAGPNASVLRDDDYTLTPSVTSRTAQTTETRRPQSTAPRPMAPVTARIVNETEQDIEELQAQLQQQDEELDQYRRAQQNVAVAEVIDAVIQPVDTNVNLDQVSPPPAASAGDESTSLIKQFMSSKRMKCGAVIGVLLVIICIVVGVVVSSNSRDGEPAASPNVGSTDGDAPNQVPTLPPFPSPALEPTTVQQGSPPTAAVPTTREPTITDSATAIFRSTWGMDHTGSCSQAAVPAAVMTCGNNAQITLLDQTEFANCATTSISEILCVGNLGFTFYSAEFSCAAIESELPGAAATLLEEEEDCLGDTPETGTWVQGIQLFLICNDEPQPIGKCDPQESIGENNACSLGYTCTEGACTAVTLTRPDITSTIVEVSC